MILLVSRKFEELDRLLKFISNELIVKETCDYIFNSKYKSHSNGNSKRGQYNANSLLSDSREFRKDQNRCFYCNSESLSTLQCGKVSNVKSRISILRKNSRCFFCLKS